MFTTYQRSTRHLRTLKASHLRTLQTSHLRTEKPRHPRTKSGHPRTLRLETSHFGFGWGGGGGWGGVGWDDNVHVPMHTQAQQPHHLSSRRAETGTALSWSVTGGVGWVNKVHVPMHTNAQQPHHFSCCRALTRTALSWSVTRGVGGVGGWGKNKSPTQRCEEKKITWWVVWWCLKTARRRIMLQRYSDKITQQNVHRRPTVWRAQTTHFWRAQTTPQPLSTGAGFRNHPPYHHCTCHVGSSQQFPWLPR